MKARTKIARWTVAGAAAAAAGFLYWQQDTAPFPYSKRWLLDLPLPFLTLRRLDDMLRPAEGERVMEIGPGTGLQSLHVAPQLGTGGQLDIVDIQQEMLDHVARRAATRGIGNIVTTHADAHGLPFEDARFDAAYLVTALGEIPDYAKTLSELRRVLKADGRLVIGEFWDQHQVRFESLVKEANENGFHLSRRIGPNFAYYAELVPAPAPGSDRT